MTTHCGSDGIARLAPLLVAFLVMTTCVSPNGGASEKGRYFVGAERLTWAAARSYCRKHGADLVTIETEDENELVRKLVKQKATSGAGCWIGATDIGQEGEWHWINGKSLAPYSNWHIGEPNNLCDGEHFVHMRLDGTWNDQKHDGSCNGYGVMQPVCERHEFKISRARLLPLPAAKPSPAHPIRRSITHQP